MWSRYRTIIVHPGPKGDRGPSSLDWAITTGERRWGVTALQAVEEMDAGPIWATRVVTLDGDGATQERPLQRADRRRRARGRPRGGGQGRRSGVPPEPLDDRRPDVIGRLRPAMRVADREFSWSDSTATIVRTIRAADGSPGARTTLCDEQVAVFDAHPGPGRPPRPAPSFGAVTTRSSCAPVTVASGSDRSAPPLGRRSCRPLALAPHLHERAEVMQPVTRGRGRARASEISYRRHDTVGVVHFDFYNGAMSTAQCRRLTAALRRAIAQPTRVLVIRGGDSFSNGIHLNVIDAAPSPSLEAWRNINAIDEVCREIIACTRQLVVTSLAGNAGAGGVMLALGADQVIVRDGVVLNPHYGTMGLFGSEYWTYVLPRRVGRAEAAALTDALPADRRRARPPGSGWPTTCCPGPPAAFEEAVVDDALRLAEVSTTDSSSRASGPPAPPTNAQAVGRLPCRGACRDEPRHLRRPPRLQRRPPGVRHQAQAGVDARPPRRASHDGAVPAQRPDAAGQLSDTRVER